MHGVLCSAKRSRVTQSWPTRKSDFIPALLRAVPPLAAERRGSFFSVFFFFFRICPSVSCKSATLTASIDRRPSRMRFVFGTKDASLFIH